MVTGASRGIGRAIADKLLGLGAAVASIQRSEGPRALDPCDLEDAEATERAVDQRGSRVTAPSPWAPEPSMIPTPRLA